MRKSLLVALLLGFVASSQLTAEECCQGPHPRDEGWAEIYADY